MNGVGSVKGCCEGGAMKEPPLVNKQAVCILLECFLVKQRLS